MEERERERERNIGTVIDRQINITNFSLSNRLLVLTNSLRKSELLERVSISVVRAWRHILFEKRMKQNV